MYSARLGIASFVLLAACSGKGSGEDPPSTPAPAASEGSTYDVPPVTVGPSHDPEAVTPGLEFTACSFDPPLPAGSELGSNGLSTSLDGSHLYVTLEGSYPLWKEIRSYAVVGKTSACEFKLDPTFADGGVLSADAYPDYHAEIVEPTPGALYLSTEQRVRRLGASIDCEHGTAYPPSSFAIDANGFSVVWSPGYLTHYTFAADGSCAEDRPWTPFTVGPDRQVRELFYWAQGVVATTWDTDMKNAFTSFRMTGSSTWTEMQTASGDPTKLNYPYHACGAGLCSWGHVPNGGAWAISFVDQNLVVTDGAWMPKSDRVFSVVGDITKSAYVLTAVNAYYEEFPKLAVTRVQRH